MKTCTKCKIERPLEDFPRKRDGRAADCKPCHRAVSLDHYRKNKPAYLARNKERRKTIYEWLKKQKEKPCMDCGNSYPYYVMQFDHRDPSAKVDSINHLKDRRMSIAALQKELDKCDLVCANCHAERTWGKK